MRVRLLGSFLLIHRGKPVETAYSPRLQALCTILLLQRGIPQSRLQLASRFWPDSTESQAQTNLRHLLHRLRHALPDADRCLKTDRHTIHWRSDMPCTLDVAEFRAALSHAEGSHDPAVQRRALEEAVSHYQGELVPGCYDEWIISERERLGIEYRAALERLAHLCEAERDYPSAIAYARSLLLVDSLDEETYRTLMRLHALNRDKSAALQIYHACVTTMERELDLEPESATQAAYQRLVDAAPAMDVHLPAGALQAAWPLVGRRQEWEQVLAAWERSVRGEAHVVTLVGEAGSGKTRMGEEFLAWAVRQGIPVAETRCYATAGMLPFAPVAAWMRTDPLYQARSTVKGVWLTELARLLPEIMRNTLI